MATPEHSKPIRLARDVLMAAVDNNWPKSQRAFERLASECDEYGLGEALMAWCSTVLAHCCGGTWDGRPVRVVPMAIETGALGGELPPEKQWELGRGHKGGHTATVEKALDWPAAGHHARLAACDHPRGFGTICDVCGGDVAALMPARLAAGTEEGFLCGAFQPLGLLAQDDDVQPYRCTEPHDHLGPHKAVIDGKVIASWGRL